MARREWEIGTPATHTVMIDHSYWFGTATVHLDGAQVHRRGWKFCDTGFEHRFKIDGVPCIVRVFNRPFAFTYELWVDGKLQ